MMRIGSVKPIVLGAIFTAVLLLTNSLAWSAEQDGKSLFEKRCMACHQLPNPDEPPPEGWEQRLQGMAPLARLKEDQKEDVLEYLLAHSQQSARAAALQKDKLLFEEKCSGCHTLDRVFLEPLTAESRRHVVKNMQELIGTGWITDEDVENILVYLDAAVAEGSAKYAAQAAESLTANATVETIFRTRCSACHSLERVYAMLGKNEESQNLAYTHTVSRMRNKAPQWMTDEEAAEIINYLRSLN